MAKRRANGEGSVFKRKDGRWVATVTYIDMDGGRKRVSRYAETQREARQQRTELVRQRDAGLLLAPQRQTLGEHLQHWIVNVAPLQRKRKTLRVYEIMIRHHITPVIGQVRLDRLQPVHIERMQTRAAEAGLAPRSIQLLRAVVSTSLTVPLRMGILLRNPVELVDAPRADHFEATMLSAKQANHLLRAAHGDRLEAIYHLALWLGMRQGEILGLRWQDIDWERKRLRVSVQLERGGTEPVLADPKTKNSRRTLPLIGNLVALLHQRRGQQLEEQLAAGTAWKEYGLVFTQPDGRAMHGHQCRVALTKLLAAAGLPKMRFHDLRHVCATLLASEKVPARMSMAILGHSSLEVNQLIYTHILDDDMTEAIEGLVAAIADADPEPTTVAAAVTA